MRTETLQHIALFDKCKNFTRAREVQAAGLYPYFKPISRSEDTVVVIEGQERIMMGSNNYLGLTHHPEVLAAAQAALIRYGSGCTGSHPSDSRAVRFPLAHASASSSVSKVRVRTTAPPRRMSISIP